MFGIDVSKFRGVLAVVAVLTSTASATITTPALAAVPVESTVKVVEYGPGILLVQLSTGANFTARTSGTPSGPGTANGTSCVNRSIDTLKAWQSLTQAALLAGKKVKIYFEVCGTSPNLDNSISGIDLIQ